jgi:hypothetical protein
MLYELGCKLKTTEDLRNRLLRKKRDECLTNSTQKYVTLILAKKVIVFY